MPRFGRAVAPALITASVIAVGAQSAAALSGETGASVGVTIGVSTRFPAIGEDRLVIYKAAGYDTAGVSGTITGAPSGASATLLAWQFRGRGFKVTGRPVRLRSSAPIRYSFRVQPSLATAYEVRVMAGGRAIATSAARTVYVAGGGRLSRSHSMCTHAACTFSFPAYLRVPAPAYNIETRKHWYLYLEVGYPKLPGYYTLNDTATASRPRKISADEFEMSFTFRIRLRNGVGRWETNFCTRNTESRDGVGLPGSHHCGDKRVSARDRYLG